MGYYAVTRSEKNDELRHFKYIRKERRKGKWVYYYKDEDAKGENKDDLYVKTEGKPESKYGTYQNVKNKNKTVDVKKSNSFFSGRSRLKSNSSGWEHETREIGKLERQLPKAKKKIKKFGKKSVKSLNKQIDRGQKWLNGLFD